MRFCYLAFFDNAADPAARISEIDLATVRAVTGGLYGLSKAHLYTPETARDLFNDDGAAPQFGLQLYFNEIADLEAAVGRDGPLQALVGLPSLAGAAATQQAMLCRTFPVPEPRPLSPAACSYCVHYPGPAADLNAWLGYYIGHHPDIMARFPAIREIEILTRIDWVDAMPWSRVHHMQRNRVMFDSPAALTAALTSPTRHEMRADFAHFPPYDGGVSHFPFATEAVTAQ
jgi:hypothetical protein